MLDAGFVFAEDGDGYVVPAKDASAGAPISRLRVSLAGRLAVLTDAQVLALTGRVGAGERFDRHVAWPTIQALAALGLAEYRDPSGKVHPGDGDTGAGGPVHAAFRTTLGAEVSQASSGHASTDQQ
jgi:hypothetical protein